jgi:hypothetical protein
MSKGNVTNLTSLDREIKRLEDVVEKKGEQLERNMAYLQEHYGRMAMNSVFRRHDTGSDSLKDRIFSAVWENEVVQKGIDSVITHMAEGATSLVDQLLNKLRSKKTD